MKKKLEFLFTCLCEIICGILLNMIIADSLSFSKSDINDFIFRSL